MALIVKLREVITFDWKLNEDNVRIDTVDTIDSVVGYPIQIEWHSMKAVCFVTLSVKQPNRFNGCVYLYRLYYNCSFFGFCQAFESDSATVASQQELSSFLGQTSVLTHRPGPFQASK